MKKIIFIMALMQASVTYTIAPNILSEREKAEIDTFSNIWHGGFFVGDPFEKNIPATDKAQYHVHYVNYNNQKMSCMHATYLNCIVPYVNETTNVLEFGPGRGAWTRCFIAQKAKTVTCIDAKTAEDNGFWKYVGDHKNIQYNKVNDFTLNCVQNDSIDFVFSALTFCHISPLMIKEYLKNLFDKMRSGAHGFIGYADYDKYNQHYKKLGLGQARIKENLNEIYLTNNGIKARWYHLGIDTMHKMLKEIGYNVVQADIGIDYRDPIAHFVKP